MTETSSTTPRRFEEMSNSNSRQLFYFEVFAESDMGSQETGESLGLLLEYIDYNKGKLIELAGYDEKDATRTAAQTVFQGASDFMREQSREDFLDRLNEIDGMIRSLKGIDHRENPRTNDDPIVEAFYTELEGHLSFAQGHERFGAWEAR